LTSARTYCWSDLTVTSTVPLPLPEARRAERGIAVRHTVPGRGERGVTWQHRWRRADRDAPWVSFGRTAEGPLVRFHDHFDAVLGGGGADVQCVAASVDDRMADLIVGQVLPLALAMMGRLVLHASAVSGAAGATAFVGFPGAGKSTLAAAFDRRGRSAVADDCVSILRTANGHELIPGCASVRLRPDAFARFGGAAAVPPDAAGKRRLAPVRAAGPQRLPLTAICVLAFDPGAGAGRLVRLEPRAAASGLLAHTYRPDIRDRAALTTELDAIARLVSAVPVWSLTAARSLDRLDELTARVDAALLT
jgi:hypothetical protein